MVDRRRRRPARTVATGRFALVWGDPPSGPAQLRYVLVDESDPGRRTEVHLRPPRGRDAGSVLPLNGARVAVRGTGRPVGARGADAGSIVGAAVDAGAVLAVEPPSAALRAEAAPAAIVGPTPWLNVLCKYADIPDEPAPPSHVRQMFGTGYPGLAHYWAEVSYGQISVAGSRTLGWRRLPGSEAEYMDGGNPNLGLLFDHAVALIADVPVVDYCGLNLFFNGGVGCCNWGTRWYATVGGITREWGITWLPPSALGYIRNVAHEMGHGYGLPHSREDAWDVMSIGTCGLPSAIHHPRFGCVDAHTLAHHKEQLGWIPPERRYVHGGGARTVALERLALPRTADYLIARVPIGDSATRFYTVETRRRAGYDTTVRGDAAVIHEVDVTRTEPAWPVRNPARGDDMWLPIEGEDTFVDAEAGVRVTVHAPSPSGSGFVVLIVAGSGIPAAPSNLRLGAVTATSIEVVWDDNSVDETAFEVWWLPDGESEWRVDALPADAISWTHAGLAPGNRFVYYVRACNEGGCSDWSNGIEAATSTPPAAPANLRPTAVTATSITVAWDDNSDDERLFQVWRTPAGQTEWTIVQVRAETTSWTHTGLLAGESYSYWVQACNDAGCSGFSNGITVTASATVPASPSELRVVGLTARSVELDWRDNSIDETEFQVWWLPIGGEGWTVVTLPAEVTRWTHEGTSSQTEYIYYVRACNDAGCSDWSNAAVVTTPSLQPPAAPSGLHVVAVTTESVELAWRDNAEDETHSQVWHTPAGGTDWTIAQVGAGVTNWTHTGLDPGTGRDYWVQACNEAGCSDFSDGVRATTLRADRGLRTAGPVVPLPPADAGRRPSRPGGAAPPAQVQRPSAAPAGRPPPVDAPASPEKDKWAGYGR